MKSKVKKKLQDNTTRTKASFHWRMEKWGYRKWGGDGKVGDIRVFSSPHLCFVGKVENFFVWFRKKYRG